MQLPLKVNQRLRLHLSRQKLRLPLLKVKLLQHLHLHPHRKRNSHLPMKKKSLKKMNPRTRVLMKTNLILTLRTTLTKSHPTRNSPLRRNLQLRKRRRQRNGESKHTKPRWLLEARTIFAVRFAVFWDMLIPERQSSWIKFGRQMSRKAKLVVSHSKLVRPTSPWMPLRPRQLS